MSEETGKHNGYITVYLYGKLKSLARHKTPQGEHVAYIPCREGDRIRDIIARLKLESAELSHLFLNGIYSGPACRVKPGDRLGLFAKDMHLLYRQYFPIDKGDEDQ
ncbi:MAG: hypothetical protein QHH10_01000 [Peptococcaceae bacterium]|nr:hypothetical protein [Peptococcaceae bacterium]MDH7523872.1 hypothetical protein [Peptococcaceae bacterium]